MFRYEVTGQSGKPYKVEFDKEPSELDIEEAANYYDSLEKERVDLSADILGKPELFTEPLRKTIPVDPFQVGKTVATKDDFVRLTVTGAAGLVGGGAQMLGAFGERFQDISQVSPVYGRGVTPVDEFLSRTGKGAEFLAQQIKKGAEFAEKEYELPAEYRGAFLESPSWKKAAGYVVQGLPSYMLAVGASVATRSPVVGAAILGVTETDYDNAVEGFKLQGLDDKVAREKAFKTAVSGASMNTMLEMIPIAGLMKGSSKKVIRDIIKNRTKTVEKLLTGKGVNDFSRKVAKGIFEEGSQELTQQLTQNLRAKLGYDKSRQLTEGLIESFIGGAGLGGIGGGVMSQNIRSVDQLIAESREEGVSNEEINQAIENIGVYLGANPELVNDNINKGLDIIEPEKAKQLDESDFRDVFAPQIEYINENNLTKDRFAGMLKKAKGEDFETQKQAEDFKNLLKLSNLTLDKFYNRAIQFRPKEIPKREEPKPGYEGIAPIGEIAKITVEPKKPSVVKYEPEIGQISIDIGKAVDEAVSKRLGIEKPAAEPVVEPVPEPAKPKEVWEMTEQEYRRLPDEQLPEYAKTGKDTFVHPGIRILGRKKYEDIIQDPIRRIQSEAKGQFILDELESKGITADTVSNKFWTQTYPNLPDNLKEYFENLLYKGTGFKPGDIVGTTEKGEDIIKNTWQDLGVEYSKDISGVVDNLEGAERGYVSLMETANKWAESDLGITPEAAMPTKVLKAEKDQVEHERLLEDIKPVEEKVEPDLFEKSFTEQEITETAEYLKTRAIEDYKAGREYDIVNQIKAKVGKIKLDKYYKNLGDLRHVRPEVRAQVFSVKTGVSMDGAAETLGMSDTELISSLTEYTFPKKPSLKVEDYKDEAVRELEMFRDAEEQPMIRERKGKYKGIKSQLRPKAIGEVSPKPIRPLGKGWATDPGSMPGEPFAIYKDKVAVAERLDEQGMVLYEVMDNEGNSVGTFNNLLDARDSAERYVTGKDVLKKAKEYFGTTDDFKKAGYILTDGTMLDLTGQTNERMGHSAIQVIYTELEKDDPVESFLDLGNVRISSEFKGIEVRNNINEQQKNTLGKYIDFAKGKLSLDTYNTVTKEYKSIKYPQGTTSEKIFADINNYYKGEEVRPISDVVKYHLGEKAGFYETLQKAGMQNPGEAKPKAGVLDIKATENKIQESALKYKFTEEGRLMFANETIESPADVAYAFRMLTNSDVERPFIVGVKNNKVISVESIGVGNVNQSAVFLDKGVEVLRKTKADSFYLVHNHPGGSIEASVEDKGVTRVANTMFSDIGIKFLGHIIIDTNKFGFIDSGNKYYPIEHRTKITKEHKVPIYEKYIEWSKDIEKLVPIKRPEHIFELIKGIKEDWSKNTGLIITSNNNQILSFQIIPSERINDIRNLVFLVKQVNGVGLAIVSENLVKDLNKLNKDLDRYNIRLIDNVALSKDKFTSAKAFNLMKKDEEYVIKEPEPQYLKEPKQKEFEGKEFEGKGFFVPKQTRKISPEMSKALFSEKPAFADLTRGQAGELSTLSPSRASELVDGKRYGIFKKEFLFPIQDADKSFNIEFKKIKQEIKDNFKGLGDKERQALFGLTERKLLSGEEMLVAKNPKIKQTEKWLRNTYDSLLDRINESRKLARKEPIQKRKDYITHYWELGAIQDILSAMGLTMTEVPNSMLSISMYTKPNSPYWKYAKRRLGEKTERDALKAISSYIEPTLRYIHFAEATTKARDILEYRVKIPSEYEGSKFESFSKFAMDYPNAYLYFTNYLNALSGKRNLLDKMFPALANVTTLSNRMFASGSIGGNLSTAITQFSSLRNTVTETGLFALKGQTLVNTPRWYKFFKENSRIGMTRQYEPMFYGERMLGSKIIAKGHAAISKAISIPVSVLDREMVGGAFLAGYFKGKSLGLSEEDAIRYGDDVCERTQASADLVDRPPVNRGKIKVAIGQFQTFVYNEWSQLRYDVFGKIRKGEESLQGYEEGGLLSIKDSRRTGFKRLGNFLLSAAILSAIYDLLELPNPLRQEDLRPFGMKKNLFTLLLEHGLNSIPFVSSARFGGSPVLKFVKSTGTLFLEGSSWEQARAWRDLESSSVRLFPGGGQIRKTTGTIKALRGEGRVRSRTGKEVIFVIDTDDIGNVIKALIYGKWASREGREYLEERINK